MGLHPERVWKKGLLPYDFFYEFRQGKDFLGQILKMGRERKEKPNQPLFARANTPEKLGASLAAIPIPSERSKSGVSLAQLKHEVRTYLRSAHVLNADFQFREGKFNLEQFKTAFRDSRMQPLIDFWGQELSRRDFRLAHQKNTKSDKYPDFSLDHVPAPFAHQTELLRLMKSFLQSQQLKFLNKKADIQFYNAADGTVAHAFGNSHIAFNLSGPSISQFEKMLRSGKWKKDEYIQLVSVLTHELIHLEEGSDEGTHDTEFFNKQQRLMECFFSFSESDQNEVDQFLSTSRAKLFKGHSPLDSDKV